MAPVVQPSSALTFGGFLRSLRQERSLSLRRLAKDVQITPTYLSDLERGNNHPPDKPLLDKLIAALGIAGEEASLTLLDLAAKERDDLPADIKEYLMNNRSLQLFIRKVQQHPNREQFCRDLLHNLI